jgi:uncharacterized protein YraI
MGNETIKEEGQGGDASRCVYQHSPEWDLPDGWPLAKNRMPERNLDCTQRGLVVRARVLLGLAVLSLFVVGLFTAGCAGSPVQGQTSQTDREATLRRIASEYAQDQDLARAQKNLSKLGLANPAQLLVTLAEQDISQGRSREEVEPLARLADGLGARSPILVAFLEPEPTATLVPPSPTPEPPSPTVASTDTPVPPTATSPATLPAPTVTATAATQPRVVAEDTANLRSGPGKAYPLVGRLNAGESAEIIARNASGDWWQLAWDGTGSAWVSGTTVKVQGPIDTVAVAKNVPPPPAPPTAAPPTAPPPTQAPAKPAGPEFRLVSRRLFTVEENGGAHDGPTVLCGNNHTLYVTVLDAAGNALNGVTVKDANGTTEKVSGDKGPGKLDFDLWWPGIDVVVIRDADGRQVTSDVARELKVDTTAIPDDVLIGGGYCSSAETCAHIKAECGCCHHLSWEAVFQRAY